MTVYWVVLTPEDGGVIDRSPTALQLKRNSNVKQALNLIALPHHPDTLLSKRQVAIFGQYALPDTPLRHGDRIEILDELRFEPNESRLRRAAHKKQQNSQASPRRSKVQKHT